MPEEPKDICQFQVLPTPPRFSTTSARDTGDGVDVKQMTAPVPNATPVFSYAPMLFSISPALGMAATLISFRFYKHNRWFSDD